MKYIKLLPSVVIALTAVLGDYVVFNLKLSQQSFTFRAFADNAAHATIAFWSALSFFSYGNYTSQELQLNTVFCTVLASFIDLDHFIIARSLCFKDLLNLNQRGIFHCATFWIISTSVLIGYSISTKNARLLLLSFITLIAVTSHLVRDANRRGIWVYPFGNTPPFSKYLYIALSIFLPYFLAVVYKHTVCFVKPVDLDFMSDVLVV